MSKAIEHITKALSQYAEPQSTSKDQCRRIFHGRGGTFPGEKHITADWYPPLLWIVLHDEPEEGWVDALMNSLDGRLEAAEVQCVVLQRRDLKGVPNEVLWGELPEEIKAQEDGLFYEVKFGSTQNCGFFLDSRPGRQWVREHAKGKHVLNLFAYTCAFSIAACAGGAESVVNIDMSRSAIKTGQRNHALNKLTTPVRFLGHDIFRSWKKLRQLGPYDLIVIDPPAFQKGSFIAENDYARLLRRLSEMAAPGADILATLNAPYFDESFLLDLFTESWPAAEKIERLANSEDFPDISPDSSLKVIHFRQKAEE